MITGAALGLLTLALPAQQGIPLNTAVTGSLAPGDVTLGTGEYQDSYTFAVVQGQQYTIDLSSPTFDTYLIYASPAGTQIDNDDGGEGTNSRLTVVADQTGTATLRVTTFTPGETGAYTIAVASGGAGGTNTGSLAPGDDTLESGEYVDWWTFEVEQGQRYQIGAQSTTFDTYLIYRSPAGTQIDDDDSGGGTNSQLTVVGDQTGQCRVGVTTFTPGETGAYTLTFARQ
jgi:hypothetical protein